MVGVQVVATVGEVGGLVLVFLVWLLVPFFYGSFRRRPRPSPDIEGPPRFDAPRGLRGWLTGFRHRRLDWKGLLGGLVPGYLGLRYGRPRDALIQALIGWPILFALAVETHGGFRPVVGGFGYCYVTFWSLLATNAARSRGGWAANFAGLDRVMADASDRKPGCPRCRMHERDASGWCAPCTARLESARIGPGDPRARVTLWTERARDEGLAGLCAEQYVTSWDAGGSRPTLRGDASDHADDASTQWRAIIEAAFVDPSRPELVWTRASWSLQLDGGLVWSARRVEAHGFVDGVLAQTWIFAPLEAYPRLVSHEGVQA